jgi:hypothetical protein
MGVAGSLLFFFFATGLSLVSSEREQPSQDTKDAHNDFPHALPADDDEPHPPHHAQDQPLEELETCSLHEAELAPSQAQDLIDCIVDLLDPQCLLRGQAHAESVCFVGAVVHSVCQLVRDEGFEVCEAGV